MGLTCKKVVSKVWFDKLTSLINERNCKIAIGKINGVEYGLDLELGILENSETGEKMDVSTYE
jgi:hypothetical protein